jgi:flagellar hook-basal body complex protein FliE
VKIPEVSAAGPGKVEAAVKNGVQKDAPGFGETLMASVREASALQDEAHRAMESLATGRSSDLHQTIIAVEKAEIALRMIAQVRNKIVAAYQELMRMQM